ncbi:uncharacterized protein LOC128237685 [Mya arenaria]|uniref:uncharacterized protein LOC128237685 n=1 Tax=Mya arenaria TaxID=6604 RepID=UPI0022E63855|nr:uncharacterized protein LOC128237685 [Mya arenaria]
MDTVSNDFKDNSKKFWAFVKSKGQESTGVAPLKNKDGFLQSGNAARANILNDQFVSAFTRENTTNIPYMGQSGIPSMPNILVDWKGVHKLLMNLKTKKATGPDELPAIILKAAATELAPALAKLFQLSLNLGEVPQDWRDASVVPLFKKGDRHQASNYIPVFLTSITCKLLEHIVHSNVMQHFDEHNILSDNQHGFVSDAPNRPSLSKNHRHTLEVVDASKYLGVTITESLTWEKHNITSKANRTLGFLRRNLRECTPPVKEAS